MTAGSRKIYVTGGGKSVSLRKWWQELRLGLLPSKALAFPLVTGSQ
ncbi:hypothetical protein RQN30_08245 [Arcanobacterium hippocoleae]